MFLQLRGKGFQEINADVTRNVFCGVSLYIWVYSREGGGGGGGGGTITVIRLLYLYLYY